MSQLEMNGRFYTEHALAFNIVSPIHNLQTAQRCGLPSEDFDDPFDELVEADAPVKSLSAQQADQFAASVFSIEHLADHAQLKLLSTPLGEPGSALFRYVIVLPASRTHRGLAFDIKARRYDTYTLDAADGRPRIDTDADDYSAIVVPAEAFALGNRRQYAYVLPFGSAGMKVAVRNAPIVPPHAFEAAKSKMQAELAGDDDDDDENEEETQPGSSDDDDERKRAEEEEERKKKDAKEEEDRKKKEEARKVKEEEDRKKKEAKEEARKAKEEEDRKKKEAKEEEARKKKEAKEEEARKKKEAKEEEDRKKKEAKKEKAEKRKVAASVEKKKDEPVFTDDDDDDDGTIDDEGMTAALRDKSPELTPTRIKRAKVARGAAKVPAPPLAAKMPRDDDPNVLWVAIPIDPKFNNIQLRADDPVPTLGRLLQHFQFLASTGQITYDFTLGKFVWGELMADPNSKFIIDAVSCFMRRYMPDQIGLGAAPRPPASFKM